MRHDFLDRYSRLDSPIHRIAAGIKLSLALTLVVAIVLLPIPLALYYVIAAIILTGTVVASRIPPAFIIKRLLFLEPFVLGVAILTLFQSNGGIIFVSILVKSSLCLLTMILLSNTTPFSELLHVLRRLRFPTFFITILALMYRYLFVLIDEAERMQRARVSRTFRKGRRFAWKSTATVIGQLFVRSTERAERIFAAMTARGWK